MTDPNAPRVFRLRSTFIERDRLALLSHLEVAHTLERTVRRAGLPFAVSQGFSPHMKIAFGAALPVGVGSTCEVFDLQLREYIHDRFHQAGYPRGSLLQMPSFLYRTAEGYQGSWTC